ncbi:MAG TPA: IS4 family transposase [Planctomycetaceae bacterium]|nr:IS4 family transposase [Planctomycetaceae bacterium]
MQRKCDMEDRREESMLSNRLSGLLEILGRDKVTGFLCKHESGRFCKRVDNVQLIWVIVGFGLFVCKSYRELFRIINVGSLQLPSRATIAAARKRLLPEWIEHLHSQVVELLATPKRCPNAFYKGLRLIGIDGTLLDCYDSDSNRKYFHRPTNQSGNGAFPKIRMVVLAELGTRVLWRCILGNYYDCERVLGEQLIRFLKPEHLLLADRHFGVAPIIYKLLAASIPFLIRTKKSHIFVVEKMLSDGSFLSTIYLGKNDRTCRRRGKTVRVIRYTINDPVRGDRMQVHVLLTNLLDPKKYPAKELIALYHERWEEEIAFREIKETLHHGEVLRSQSPELVKQELWGMLLAHFVIRKLLYQAAVANAIAPSSVSFKATFEIVQLRLDDAPTGKRRTTRSIRAWFKLLIEEISLEVIPSRQPRINPRVVKKRSKSTKTKYDYHRNPRPPNPNFRETIRMSI